MLFVEVLILFSCFTIKSADNVDTIDIKSHKDRIENISEFNPNSPLIFDKINQVVFEHDGLMLVEEGYFLFPGSCPGLMIIRQSRKNIMGRILTRPSYKETKEMQPHNRLTTTNL